MMIALCVISAAFLQTFCLLFGLFWLYRRERAKIQATIDRQLAAWFTAPVGEPHKAAQIVDAMGVVIGSAAARSMMANLGQRASSAAQVANGAADMIQAQSNPLVALLTGGKRGKGAAMMRLAEMLGPMVLGGGNGHPPASVEAPPPRRHRD